MRDGTSFLRIMFLICINLILDLKIPNRYNDNRIRKGGLMKNITFEDFLKILNKEETSLAITINDLYLASGCKREIKESASGFTVSYLSGETKKTLANFICRKTGLKIRITPQKPFECEALLHNLPENMKKDMVRGNTCKRLSGENVCNPRCLMGYAFTLDGEIYHKCRSMAFLFAVTEENLHFILAFIKKSLNK